MNFYQKLGILSISLLVVAMALSGFVLTAKLSQKRIYAISFTVLGLMLAVSFICTIIYGEYGHTANWPIRLK